MKQEDKNLLLKDLCARLPYGVMCHYNCVAEYGTIVLHKANCVNKLEGIIPFNEHIGFMVDCDKIDALEGDIKPYLRPMSSMTEEERKEYELLANHCIVNSIGFVYLEAAPFIDWLNAHQFDYRGLIERGLAIEVTEENNPYKE